MNKQPCEVVFMTLLWLDLKSGVDKVSGEFENVRRTGYFFFDNPGKVVCNEYMYE